MWWWAQVYVGLSAGRICLDQQKDNEDGFIVSLKRNFIQLLYGSRLGLDLARVWLLKHMFQRNIFYEGHTVKVKNRKHSSFISLEIVKNWFPVVSDASSNLMRIF